MTCPVCQGAGRIDCTGCNAGWMTVGSTYDYAPPLEVPCVECDGQGGHTCAHCGGTGESDRAPESHDPDQKALL